MIKFTLAGLKELGFTETQVYTTMELRMKCGIGKCGRCNIGSKYVCKDGPVFRFDELGRAPRRILNKERADIMENKTVDIYLVRQKVLRAG